MNKNDFITFKFLSSIYLKIEEKKLNSLDVEIKALHQQIENEKKLVEQNGQFLDKLIEENVSMKNNCNSLLKLFENTNKTISIRNNNYDISIWENVYIKKKSSYYVIQTKREQDIYVFNENMNDSIEYILNLDYHILVLSVYSNRILLQFRLLQILK